MLGGGAGVKYSDVDVPGAGSDLPFFFVVGVVISIPGVGVGCEEVCELNEFNVSVKLLLLKNGGLDPDCCLPAVGVPGLLSLVFFSKLIDAPFHPVGSSIGPTTPAKPSSEAPAPIFASLTKTPKT